MNISLSDDLRRRVDEQVAARGYGSSAEYVRDLIRRDLDRARLRTLLVEGASSPPGTPATAQSFDALRARAGASKG